MTETPCSSETTDTRQDESQAEPMLRWLEDEFPDWHVDVEPTATWEGDFQPLWIARRDGHHPQSELTAAKLHTRLTEYLERESRRQALMN